MTKLAALARIARRDLLRFKLRSLLIVVMIALPVAGMVGSIVYARTIKVEPAEQRRFLWGAADGIVAAQGYSTKPPPVPTGVRLVAQFDFSLRVQRGDGRVEIVDAHTADLGDPIHAGQLTLLNGRIPRTSREVLASPKLQQWLHAKVGDRVRALSSPDPLTITGTVRENRFHDQQELVSPDLAPDRTASSYYSAAWLIQMPPGRSISSLRAPNGYILETLYTPSTSVATTVDVSMVAGTFVLIEVVFVAAAALAVGARRRERTLAVLAAAGGQPRDLGGVVLITGFFLGALGVLSGIAVGIAGARLALVLLAGLISHDVQHLRVPVLAVLGAGGLGLVAALIAATLPARTVARMNVAAALGGRPLRHTASKRTPLTGIVTIGCGVLLVSNGIHAGHSRWVELGIAATLVGTALCGAIVLHAAARISSHFPAAIRFAARDADRQRRRDAPALGAILAVLATAIALSTLTPQLELHTTFGRFPGPQALPAGETRLEPTFFADPSADIGNGPAAATAIRHALPGHNVGLLQETLSGTIALGAAQAEFVDSNKQPFDLDAFIPDHTAARMLGLSPAQVQQLRDGRIIVWSDSHDHAGTFPQLTLSATRPGRQTGSTEILIENRTSTRFGLPTIALMSDDTAQRLGIASRRPVVLIDRTNKADQTTALHVFESAIGFPAELGTNGLGLNVGDYKQPWNITDALVRQHRLVVAAALLLALGVLAGAIALSSLDARRDVARLTTLGLSPRGHRTFSSARAGLLAALAGILALPAGLLPAYAVVANEPARSFRPDYLTIAIVMVAFPIAVIALAWVTARPIARPLTADVS